MICVLFSEKLIFGSWVLPLCYTNWRGQIVCPDNGHLRAMPPWEHPWLMLEIGLLFQQQLLISRSLYSCQLKEFHLQAYQTEGSYMFPECTMSSDQSHVDFNPVMKPKKRALDCNQLSNEGKIQKSIIIVWAPNKWCTFIWGANMDYQRKKKRTD